MSSCNRHERQVLKLQSGILCFRLPRASHSRAMSASLGHSCIRVLHMLQIEISVKFVRARKLAFWVDMKLAMVIPAPESVHSSYHASHRSKSTQVISSCSPLRSTLIIGVACGCFLLSLTHSISSSKGDALAGCFFLRSRMRKARPTNV